MARAAFGGQDSVATVSGGSPGASASTSPPPVCRAGAAAGEWRPTRVGRRARLGGQAGAGDCQKRTADMPRVRAKAWAAGAGGAALRSSVASS